MTAGLGSLATQAARLNLNLGDMLGLNSRFGVVIDGMDLGKWGQCQGLGVEFTNVKLAPGGQYDYETILPDQVKYKTVSLKRAINAADSMRVQSWLARQVQDWVHNANHGTGGTAVITLFDSQAAPLISWSLRNVFPSKWDGPTLDAANAGIAMETLDLVHEGFL